MILLNCHFQDEILFQALARNLAEIISRKDDRYIALGWCTLTRSLIESEISMDKLMTNGIREMYTALLKILSSCMRHLLALMGSGSILQGGFELPTRLAVASADFILSITVALTRKDVVSDSSRKKEKLRNSNSQDRPVSLLYADSCEGKVKEKATRTSSVFLKDMGTKLLLWDHMDDLIILVGRLKTWSRKSRSLHCRGLERVLKWLQSTRTQYVCFQNEAGRHANAEDWNNASLILLETLWHAVTLRRLQLSPAIQRIVGRVFIWNSGNGNHYNFNTK